MSVNAATVLVPLPWQSALWDSLAERKLHNRLPHALLLHGAAGIGKGRLARLLVASLLCENVQQQLPCGGCHACQMLASGSHPDFFLADAAYGIAGFDDDDDKKSKKTKKATAPSKQIKIDCIRDLIHFSTQSAHQGGKRVALIEPAEWLNHNAANALLKTLEEPGADTHIILVSHQPSRLLPTLRSRCQAVFCATPEREQSLQWLKPQGVATERANTVLDFSYQAPLKALAAANDNLDVLHQEVIKTLQDCRQKKVDYLSAAEILSKHDAAMVLDWWLTFIHRQASAKPEKFVLQFYDELLAARRKVLGTANPNTRMLFETLLITWMTPHSKIGAT
ncbi:MAG: DNA polymerase III subunit delta' [Pseudomonadales bacterium]|jgi:DNA polymerase-3 subunit delta'